MKFFWLKSAFGNNVSVVFFLKVSNQEVWSSFPTYKKPILYIFDTSQISVMQNILLTIIIMRKILLLIAMMALLFLFWECPLERSLNYIIIIWNIILFKLRRERYHSSVWIRFNNLVSRLSEAINFVLPGWINIFSQAGGFIAILFWIITKIKTSIHLK